MEQDRNGNDNQRHHANRSGRTILMGGAARVIATPQPSVAQRLEMQPHSRAQAASDVDFRDSFAPVEPPERQGVSENSHIRIRSAWLAERPTDTQGPQPSSRGQRAKRAPGDVIAERFELLDLLGEGSMAQVFRARDQSNDRLVAVKVMHRALARDDTLKQRMRYEAQLTSSIISKHVVEIIDLGQLMDDSVYFAMELLDGETLEEMLQGPLPSCRTIVELAGQIATGLAVAHAKGIVHRDLKPENIFIVHEEEDHQLTAKVLDFGVAKRPSGAALTAPGTILGTPHYMAPEQALANCEVDARADVYALGAIMFELASGAPPFTGDDNMALVMAHLTHTPPRLAEIRQDIPVALSDIIARCLEKKPTDRYPNGAALAAALRNCEVDSAAPPPIDDAPTPSTTMVAVYQSANPQQAEALSDRNTQRQHARKDIEEQESSVMVVTDAANDERSMVDAHTVSRWLFATSALLLLAWLAWQMASPF